MFKLTFTLKKKIYIYLSNYNKINQSTFYIPITQ